MNGNETLKNLKGSEYKSEKGAKKCRLFQMQIQVYRKNFRGNSGHTGDYLLMTIREILFVRMFMKILQKIVGSNSKGKSTVFHLSVNSERVRNVLKVLFKHA